MPITYGSASLKDYIGMLQPEMCRIGKYITDVSDKERRASTSNLWGAADSKYKERRGQERQMSSHRRWTTATATPTTATPITAPPSPLPSLRRLSRRCAVIAVAAPPPSLPSLRHHCCAATTIAVQPPPPPSLRDHKKHTGLPSARQQCLCLPSARR